MVEVQRRVDFIDTFESASGREENQRESRNDHLFSSSSSTDDTNIRPKRKR